MTHVRQSVVGVVIYSHFFLHDPVNAEKRAQFGQFLWAEHIACILKEREICFFDEI